MNKLKLMNNILLGLIILLFLASISFMTGYYTIFLEGDELVLELFDLFQAYNDVLFTMAFGLIILYYIGKLFGTGIIAETPSFIMNVILVIYSCFFSTKLYMAWKLTVAEFNVVDLSFLTGSNAQTTLVLDVTLILAIIVTLFIIVNTIYNFIKATNREVV